MNTVKSPKQDAFCWLIGHGFIILRAIQSSGAGGSPEWLLEHRSVFEQGFALADLLHRVHGSIIEPGFVDNDITFINFAIPHYLDTVGDDVDPAVLKRFVALYDAVPEYLRASLTWEPTSAQRKTASKVEY